jgi:HTH-type transcriptional regulator, transcriptional repressor of NAD biosynthesis genes
VAAEACGSVIRVCLHGPESVGKSVLAAELATHFNTRFVPEYGRTYCEAFGTDLDNTDLLRIAQTQVAMAGAAAAQANRLLILDTDPLMTAVWSDMMLGARDPWFAGFDATADLYLLLDIDLPWVDDGMRIYGDAATREDFFNRCRDEIIARGVAWALISGQGEARTSAALAAIARAFPEL